MNFKFSSAKAFTALIAVFVLHNVEESVSFCRYPIQSPFTFVQPASCSQFLWAVSILSIVGIVLYIFAMQTKKPAVYLFISTALAVSILFNVFVPHLFVALYTIHYTPGLLLAVMLNLPVSLIVLTKNRKMNTTLLQFVKQSVAGLVFGYLIFALVMLLVMKLV